MTTDKNCSAVRSITVKISSCSASLVIVAGTHKVKLNCSEQLKFKGIKSHKLQTCSVRDYSFYPVMPYTAYTFMILVSVMLSIGFHHSKLTYGYKVQLVTISRIWLQKLKLQQKGKHLINENNSP